MQLHRRGLPKSIWLQTVINKGGSNEEYFKIAATLSLLSGAAVADPVLVSGKQLQMIMEILATSK